MFTPRPCPAPPMRTTFVDEAALKGYAVHPAHVAVADGKVRPYTAVRTCLDFEV